ncbi:MAG: hypothetical protein PUP92_32485 [Rhizonema sp. PD38]|nr:hypothetical protein [Rhizonema sp. PD38]
MKEKLTRRQFGHLAMATTAVAALSTFANKAFAQTQNQTILGVRPGSITNTVNTDQTASLIENVVTATQSIVVESVVVDSIDLVQPSDNRGLEVETPLTTTPVLEFGEQLSGFASLSDGTLVVAATKFAQSNTASQPTRLIFLSASPKTQTVLGLNQQEALESLVLLSDKTLAGLVTNKNGTPPVRLVNINPQTGEITDRRELPENQRFTNLVECPDGNLYAIAVERNGETSLVQINNGQSTPLYFNDQAWNSGFSDLVCSSSNQLFALGARRYELTKYLHAIEKNTGVITRLRDFDVAKITIQAS